MCVCDTKQRKRAPQPLRLKDLFERVRATQHKRSVCEKGKDNDGRLSGVIFSLQIVSPFLFINAAPDTAIGWSRTVDRHRLEAWSSFNLAHFGCGLFILLSL